MRPAIWVCRSFFFYLEKKEVVRMRRFLIGLCILVGGVYACQRVGNESVWGVLYTQEVDTSLVKKYVYENRFIDIDIYAVARMIWAGEQVDTDVMAQVKVALYRYFSHVRIERDKYVCDLASGKEISVSSRVFTALQENLGEMNIGVLEMRKRDTALVLPAIDEAYLRSLLQ